MISFLKNNSYNIFKMCLNQIGLAMLAIVMSFFTYSNDTLSLLTSICCTIIYIYILYTMTYELGQKDKPAIDGGRAELKPLKGFWLSLCANSVNIICGIMAVVFSFFVAYQQPIQVVNNANENINVYTRHEITSSETSDSSETKYTYDKVSLYSNHGGTAKIYEYDNSRYSEVVDASGTVALLYDEQGNELELYTDIGEQISTKQKGVENWASNLYGIPVLIATFFQMTYFGIRSVLFNNSEFVYLFTPIIPIIFCAIAYKFGATGRRLFFFLPERKQKPPKR